MQSSRGKRKSSKNTDSLKMFRLGAALFRRWFKNVFNATNGVPK